MVSDFEFIEDATEVADQNPSHYYSLFKNVTRDLYEAAKIKCAPNSNLILTLKTFTRGSLGKN